MSQATKGPDLELRAHRLAWHLGYYSKKNIFLYSDEGNQITEIDVIGIRFDSTLSPDYLLIETKSEKGFASILKLKGLLDYFNSNSAYIIRPNITPDIIRFAESLRISAFHTSRIDEIEKELNIDDEWKYSFSPENDYKVSHYIELLKENRYYDELELINYFWEERDPFYVIKIIIESNKNIFKRIKKADSDLRDALIYLNLELFTLFIIGLMRCCGDLYKYPTHQRYRIFQERLVSGKLSYKEKEELLDKFYSFLKNYSKSSGIKMDIKRKDLSLIPPYGEKLYNLINVFIENSCYIINLPLFMDIFLYKHINETKIIKKEIIKELKNTDIKFEIYEQLITESATFLFENLPDFITLE